MAALEQPSHPGRDHDRVTGFPPVADNPMRADCHGPSVPSRTPTGGTQVRRKCYQPTVLVLSRAAEAAAQVWVEAWVESAQKKGPFKSQT